MNIYLATGNLNKKREMTELFPEHTIVLPTEAGLSFDPAETGATFYENSIIKARALWNMVHCPVLADDSGICVDALGGAPGIFSARYGGASAVTGLPDGKKLPQDEQNRLLIQQLNDALAAGMDAKRENAGGLFAQGPRSAHYTCAMTLYLGPDRLFVAQDTMEGAIVSRIEDARGEGGFGYDPIFFLPRYGKTAAELTAAEKNAISHRGKAARVIKKIAENVMNF